MSEKNTGLLIALVLTGAYILFKKKGYSSYNLSSSTESPKLNPELGNNAQKLNTTIESKPLNEVSSGNTPPPSKIETETPKQNKNPLYFKDAVIGAGISTAIGAGLGAGVFLYNRAKKKLTGEHTQHFVDEN